MKEKSKTKKRAGRANIAERAKRTDIIRLVLLIK